MLALDEIRLRFSVRQPRLQLPTESFRLPDEAVKQQLARAGSRGHNGHFAQLAAILATGLAVAAFLWTADARDGI